MGKGVGGSREACAAVALALVPTWWPGLYSIGNILARSQPISVAEPLAREILHVLISWTRWFINSFVVILALDDVYKTRRLRAPKSPGGATADDRSSSGRHIIPIGIGASFVAGAALTVPWALACPLPSNACLAVFLPYEGTCGQSHKAAYMAAYVCVALAHVQYEGCKATWASPPSFLLASS